ncbi:MAG TPA: hypothetical protein VLB73_01145 [Patescibacteria group bacterium]|nr:hypothetical protein [Patescibacteria group bacterium]
MIKLKLTIILLVFGILSITSINTSHAQMMGTYGTTPSVTASPTDIQQQQDEAQGKQLFQELQNNQTNCQKLTSSDFEKIGEYVMSQRFNNTNAHIQMNDNIKGMMGDNGEENMHTQLGITAAGCSTNRKGGGNTMMGWNGFGMMGSYGVNGGFWGFLFSGIILHTLICIDLILLGVWLWKQIRKK